MGPRMRRASCMSLGTAGKTSIAGRVSSTLNSHVQQLASMAASQARKLQQPLTDGDPLGMDGAQVAVLQQLRRGGEVKVDAQTHGGAGSAPPLATLTCTMKSSVASCSASSPSTVQRNGSGATLLVISRAYRQKGSSSLLRGRRR